MLSLANVSNSKTQTHKHMGIDQTQTHKPTTMFFFYDGAVGGVGWDFWLMGFGLFLGFVMRMAEQKNELKEWDVTVLFVAFGLFVGFVMGSHVYRSVQYQWEI